MSKKRQPPRKKIIKRQERESFDRRPEMFAPVRPERPRKPSENTPGQGETGQKPK